MIKILTIFSVFLVCSHATSACVLLESGRNSPHGVRKLSTYWAQEFTGADLVRSDLIAKNIFSPENLIDIWDAKPRLRNNHGERVSQLIAGPHRSALLPKEEPIKYQDVEFERGTMEPADKFIKLFRECSLSKTCPEFINNSMSWLKSRSIKNVVSKMADSGILVVTSAGNSRRLVESGKRNLAGKQKIVLVGNTNVFGFPAKFTDSAPEVTISAPADNSLTTFDYQDRIKNFSGTSGSAPQVLASLASFKLISGVIVDGELAKVLLQSTALKILPQPNNIGSGSLNAYKVYELAKIVKAKCRNQSKSCALKVIKAKRKMVSHKSEKKLYRKLRKAFPGCADGSTAQRMFPDTSCKRKRIAFTDLRKTALLKSDDSKLWKILSCIAANEGLGKNAQFYKNLSRYVSKSDALKIAEYYKFNTDANLIKYTLSNPKWVARPEYALKVIKRAKADWTVDNYLLTYKSWRDYFHDYLDEATESPLESLSAANIRKIL